MSCKYAELKDVTTMITAARSRQIRINLIIQNFAQLNQVYGKENAETIKGNCGNMIYLLSSELTALEEISKLCGDKKIKSKGKDKPDETRPLISVTDLQKLKFKDAIIIKQRQSPFQVKLKGVDEYNWNIPKYEKSDYPTREKQPINLFDMKAFVKDHKKDAMGDMFGPKPGGYSPPPFGSNSPFGGGLNNNQNPQFNTLTNNINNNKKEDKYEVDDLIKKIDAKIAELEAEEKAEKNKSLGGSVDKKGLDVEENNNIAPISNVPVYNNNDLKKIVEPNPQDAVKVSENIEKIIDKIDDDNVSDDEFFDDFFSDE